MMRPSRLALRSGIPSRLGATACSRPSTSRTAPDPVPEPVLATLPRRGGRVRADVARVSPAAVRRRPDRAPSRAATSSATAPAPILPDDRGAPQLPPGIAGSVSPQTRPRDRDGVARRPRHARRRPRGLRAGAARASRRTCSSEAELDRDRRAPRRPPVDRAARAVQRQGVGVQGARPVRPPLRRVPRGRGRPDLQGTAVGHARARGRRRAVRGRRTLRVAARPPAHVGTNPPPPPGTRPRCRRVCRALREAHQYHPAAASGPQETWNGRDRHPVHQVSCSTTGARATGRPAR